MVKYLDSLTGTKRVMWMNMERKERIAWASARHDDGARSPLETSCCVAHDLKWSPERAAICQSPSWNGESRVKWKINDQSYALSGEKLWLENMIEIIKYFFYRSSDTIESHVREWIALAVCFLTLTSFGLIGIENAREPQKQRWLSCGETVWIKRKKLSIESRWIALIWLIHSCFFLSPCCGRRLINKKCKNNLCASWHTWFVVCISC